MGASIPHPRVPLIDDHGLIQPEWYRFLTEFQRDLEAAAVTPGSGLTQGGSGLGIATGGVGSAQLRTSEALSVMGNAFNTSGSVHDIKATRDGHVLQRSGDNVMFRIPRLPSYRISELPNAPDIGRGTQVYVINDVKGATLAFSNGTQWLTIPDLLTLSPWNPAPLFSGAPAGAWYDPSDLSTLWQDTAATVAVTTAGQSVARINDKSGNGNNLTQATAGSRPTYQVDGNGKAYLLFDSVDDYLSGTVTGFAALPFDRVSAIQQVSWTSTGIIFGSLGNNQLRQYSATPGISLYDGASGAVVSNALAVGVNGVVVERHIAGASQLAVNNGSYVTGNAGSTAGGSTFFIAEAPVSLRLYALVMRAGTLTDIQMELLRGYCADQAGVVL